MTSYSEMRVEDADRLLDLLSTDDEFRLRFTQQPLEALAECGFRATDGASAKMPPFYRCLIVDLAPKEALRAARAQLRRALTQGTSYNSPLLEAASVERMLLTRDQTREHTMSAL